MREARTDLGELVDQLRRDLGDALHVAAVARMQHPARRPSRPTRQPSFTISGRLRSISRVTVNSSFMIGAGPFSRASSSPASQPATAISRDTFSVNSTDFFEPYFMHEHGDGRAETEEPHAVAALARDLVALRRERQAVDLDHVVEHAREHLHHLAVGLPVEARLVGERIDHEFGEIDRAEKAGAVGRKRLLAAGVGGADGLRPPVVVHLVDPVDQDESRLREIVGRGHDQVPDAARRQRLVHLAGDQAFLVRDVARRVRPLAPHEFRGIRRDPAARPRTRSCASGKASFHSRRSSPPS